jgi:hypothetical protein
MNELPRSPREQPGSSPSRKKSKERKKEINAGAASTVSSRAVWRRPNGSRHILTDENVCKHTTWHIYSFLVCVRERVHVYEFVCVVMCVPVWPPNLCVTNETSG